MQKGIYMGDSRFQQLFWRQEIETIFFKSDLKPRKNKNQKQRIIETLKSIMTKIFKKIILN